MLHRQSESVPTRAYAASTSIAAEAIVAGKGGSNP
jgi:hypothetical protein